jgi:hypothetical protein
MIQDMIRQIKQVPMSDDERLQIYKIIDKVEYRMSYRCPWGWDLKDYNGYCNYMDLTCILDRLDENSQLYITLSSILKL